jgi:hypothetical protein
MMAGWARIFLRGSPLRKIDVNPAVISVDPWFGFGTRPEAIPIRRAHSPPCPHVALA